MRRRAIARVVVVIGIVIQVEEGNRITCSRSRGPTMSTSQEKTTLALLRRWSVPKKWTAGRSPQNEQIIVMHLRMNAWLNKNVELHATLPLHSPYGVRHLVSYGLLLLLLPPLQQPRHHCLLIPLPLFSSTPILRFKTRSF